LSGVENYHPVKFLDELEGNKHVVMLYDDENYGDMLIARYFTNGLEKGESCVFFTDEKPEKIEEMLRRQGIDVNKYKSRNSLRIYQTKPPPSDSPENLNVLDILRSIRADSTKGMRGPFRFAGRTIMDIVTTMGMLQGMEVEKTGQRHFAEFDNAQMCFYDVRKMEKTRRNEWISELLKNHDKVFYASSPEKAVGFDTSILEEDDA
jgi:MEDS: MEthanogen/methylotroph, DcmR Sensory domain